MSDKRIEEVVRHLHPEDSFQRWHGGSAVSAAFSSLNVDVALWKSNHDNRDTAARHVSRRANSALETIGNY